MKRIVDKTVNLNLVGVNGNSFAIMGAFRRQAQIEGRATEEIKLVLEEAKKSDYIHLLGVIDNHCEPKEIDE